jgi:hypothetical protein
VFDDCGGCGGAAVYDPVSGLYDLDDGLGSIYCDCESNFYDECDECACSVGLDECGSSGANYECWNYDDTLIGVCDETKCDFNPDERIIIIPTFIISTTASTFI